VIDRELEPYLAMWTKAWADVPDDAPVATRRARLERLAQAARQPLPDGIESVVAHIPAGARPVRVRMFRPTSGPPAPALIYMHGGGWIQGSPETHDAITAGIAGANRQTVISVDYALAPEHPFPAAVEDCRAVVEWVFASAGPLNIRPGAIAIGGDSAGGNLAAAMTLIFRSTPLRFSGQLLFYPPVDFAFDRPSFVENADGPIITAASIPGVMTMYLPNPVDRTNPLAAPLLAKDHAGLPPAFIAVAEHDPLRDEGLAYAERLSAAGVPVELHEGPGLIHGYLRAMSYATAVRSAFGAACAWLRRQKEVETVAPGAPG
jgi:acetyl esterase